MLLKRVEDQQKVTGICLTLYPFPTIQKNYLSHVYIRPLRLIVDVNLMLKFLSWLLNKLKNTQNSGHPWDGYIKYSILFFACSKLISGPENTRNSEFPWDLVRRTPLRRLLLHCSHPEWHILRKNYQFASFRFWIIARCVFIWQCTMGYGGHLNKKVQKVDKTKPPFLVQKYHQFIFAALFELLMSHIYHRKKWLT